jgi:predicted MFS family arabinose efflux permease
MSEGVEVEQRNALAPDPPVQSWLRATISGLCASLVGIGMARFAYAPLIPALIQAGWFTPSQAAYLGAANLAGYLAGALLGRLLAARPARPVLRLMMIVATAAFFACAYPLSFLWVFAWRFAAGLSGGVLMVLAATTVLPHVPAARRGVASGAIFMGVGIGVCASGTLVPLLLRWGLVETWLGLGILAFALTVLAWSGWPAAEPGRPAAEPGRRQAQAARRASSQTGAVRALYLQYGLNAIGLVPHMVFLVDYVARGLALGLQTGARYWVLYGVGAMLGPVLTGRVADWIGFRRTLRIAYVLQVLAVGLPALTTSATALMLSSVIVGTFTPGIVPLVFGRVLELAPAGSDGAKGAWSAATTSYALMQAAAAYGFSFVFAQSGGGYAALFGLGACAIALALAIDLWVETKRYT